MTVVRTALRLVTQLAIKDRTMAGDRVRDSSIVSLENVLAGAANTVVLIYTDDASDRPTGKDVWGTAQTLDLTLVIGVAGAYRVKVKGGEGEEEVTEFAFPPTDESAELSLDVIERQIKMALTDPNNPWAEIWKGLVVGIDQWSSTRGASTKEGARYAARQLVIRLQPVDDPVPGAAAKGAWKAFLEAIEAESAHGGDRDLGPTPALLRALIEGKEMAPEVRAAMENGWTQGVTSALGIGRWRREIEGPENRVASHGFYRRPLGDRTE